MPSEWRAVPGWPGYEVSDAGAVRSYLRRGYGLDLSAVPHAMEVRTNRAGYAWLTLTSRGRPARRALVHRLVLAAFVGPCPEGMEGCHNDGNRTNNALTNLRWDTRRNNHADKIPHGTSQRGERHGNAKLSADSVRAIRAARADGETIVSIGRRFGIGHSHVSRLCNGSCWGHLESQ